MKIGLSLPQIGDLATPDAVSSVATQAEDIGFDSLWVMERLLAPRAPRDPYPGTPDLSWPAAFGTCLDPLDTLTFAAAHTSRVGLGTSVLNVPWYQPVTLARRLATLDVLSGGRLRMGLGLGWSTDEFEALGVDRAGLGRRLDDSLDAMEALWGADPVEHHGLGYRVVPSSAGPKPVQHPRPPLYLGAFTEPALRRVARRADGWITVFLPRHVVAATYEHLRVLASEAGRDPETIGLVVRANAHVTEVRATPGDVPFVGTTDQIADEIAGYADLGTDELHLELQFSPGITTAQQLVDTGALIHDRVRTLLGQRAPAAVARTP